MREATAEILGVHMSAIPKMIRRGDLTPREKRPRLEREEVEALGHRRHPDATARSSSSPDAQHDWLGAQEAAALMDVGAEAVRVRARQGRPPSEVYDGRRWFRRDHLELVKRADEVNRGQSIF